MTLQSCDAQHFDLADLKFPVKKAEIDKFKPEKGLLGEAGFNLLVSAGSEVMYFNKEQLSGGTAGDDAEGRNQVSFYSSMKDGDIYGYRLQTYTTAESKKLEKALQTKLGKALMDRSSANRARVWESADQKVIYLLEYGKFSADGAPESDFADLIVIDKAADGLYKHRLTGGPFQYYGDYVEARAGKQGKYTYVDFLKEKKAAGSTSYEKGDHTVQ